MVSSHIIVSLEVRVLVGQTVSESHLIPSVTTTSTFLIHLLYQMIPDQTFPINALLISCPQCMLHISATNSGWTEVFSTLVSVYLACPSLLGSLVHDLRPDFHDSFRNTGILPTLHSSFNVQKLLYLSGMPQRVARNWGSFSGPTLEWGDMAGHWIPNITEISINICAQPPQKTGESHDVSVPFSPPTLVVHIPEIFPGLERQEAFL